tara:strand:- start:970 stop:1836 length:867 start_codon:yes stop_codon:yes gene_type:complete
MIHPSELVLNNDDSIYHLHLRPEHLADKIILAGDPGRIELISSKFDQVEYKIQNREFITHTGTYNNQRISAIATGIGTDNIDIVLNELDAVVNVDLKKRTIKKKKKSLEFVRIGTCGSLHESVLSDEVVASTHAVGLDGLLNFYNYKMKDSEEIILTKFKEHMKWDAGINAPYLASANRELFHRISKGFHQGITITANGFYAPQGRSIRLKTKNLNQNSLLRSFNYNQQRILNYEMETSALYGLSSLLGHKACTVCAVVANRYANSFSKNYKAVIEELVDNVLDRLTN